MATLFAAPAGAAPNDQPTTPPTPAPAQPGVNESPSTPETTQPDPNKQDPQKPESKPTPSQPGVTTPDSDHAAPDQKDPRLGRPSQPGVTTPRVAPLPVPGQQPGEPQPAVVPDQAAPQPGQEAAPQPGTQGGENAEAQPETLVQPQKPRWQAPRQETAPPAPVVEMTGPHAEVGANINGNRLLPGYVANTHHFSNEAGYVGTIGYRTPTGQGEAGVSVEFVDKNTVKLTTYTGGEGLADNNATAVFDTTQLNMAKAAVEDWIREQPGGAAALEAAAQVKLPLQSGDIAPQTVDVAGVTAQWGGSLQY
ncbi:hypothetical protein OHA40_10380 [Nocardia sp. NBC_00508]|uniref:hypothetical protein n=1 Tax=Nocardia sp. NBC_00508 TaxID=2975992 RepID=UPI002E80D3B1|nr:hypothetical protein [Nocardia sp. NBC_00508]WUD68472.1 hypothetical protein OHA40_10380 [Nocardia sp. NBC_00508]